MERGDPEERLGATVAGRVRRRARVPARVRGVDVKGLRLGCGAALAARETRTLHVRSDAALLRCGDAGTPPCDAHIACVNI